MKDRIDQAAGAPRMTRRRLVQAGSAVAALAHMPGAWAHTPRDRIAFLHVNDVYEIAPRQGRGGFAELMTLLRAARAEWPGAVTTLGGDFLSPSLLSGVTKGSHMIELFNAIGVDLAVFGNHEFDFGAQLCAERIAQSDFPWLGTNVRDGAGRPFGGSVDHLIREIGGWRVGIIGLLTAATPTLSRPGPDVTFPDPLAAARAAVETLEAEGVDLIVALTHLSIAEDRDLAAAVPEIDLILGGHDHDPITFYENGTLILKAGYDAHFLGIVTLDLARIDTEDGPALQIAPSWQLRTTAGVAPDPAIADLVGQYQAALDAALDIVIGRAAVELDSRRSSVRTAETGFGNLVTDALRAYLEADIALVNGGSLRGDRLYAAGSDLTRKDILAELPFGNVGVLVELSGADLLAALENGVSAVEAVDGRFPQVSGLRLVWDPSLPPGGRVVAAATDAGPIDPAARYRVATNEFLAEGGDGYAALTEGRVLVDRSAGRLLATIVMDAVAAQGEVTTAIEGRIMRR